MILYQVGTSIPIADRFFEVIDPDRVERALAEARLKFSRQVGFQGGDICSVFDPIKEWDLGPTIHYAFGSVFEIETTLQGRVQP